MKGIPCEWRQWGWRGLGKLVHRSGNIWGNNSLICKSSSACGVPSMGSRSTIWRRHEIQLHAAQGNFEKCICLRPFSSQLFQVTLEDSGTTLATTTNPNIVDEKCGRGYCSICEVAAPVRRVTIRGLCQLSIFNRSLLKHILTWLLPPGFTITSSTRTGSPCLWEATLPFSSTTDPWAPGCGTANSILTISKWEIILFGQCYVDYIQGTTITWCHRYDRKDPSIVAISLSPEETLLLGFFFLPKKLYFWMTQGCTAWTFLMSGTTSATLELDSLGWDRSSRCHQTLIQGVFLTGTPPKSSKYKKVNLG